MRGFLQKQDRGQVALITVIMVSAIILITGISAAYIGQTEVILNGNYDRGEYARSLVETCGDEALHRLKLNSSYTGGTVSVGASDTCTIAVSGSGTSRTLTLSATSDVYTAAATVAASQKTNTAGNAQGWHIDSWTEINPP